MLTPVTVNDRYMGEKKSCYFFFIYDNTYVGISKEDYFSLHMHAKPSFAHRLQTAKTASYRTSAQNNGPRAQKNGPWV